ncbi:MAG: hypothetical protein ABEK29_05995, partial [Bradymonadaceae bacterium]
MNGSPLDITDPSTKTLRTVLLVGLLGVVAHQFPSPWWDGQLLAIRPVLPDPSGAFVEPPETRETVKEKLATVELDPTAGSSSSNNDSAPADESAS